MKKYEEGYTRTVAKVFTLHEIQAFMRLSLRGPYWQLRKAFVAVAYLGGLRSEESHQLRWGLSDKGIFVNFTHAKQTGEKKPMNSSSSSTAKSPHYALPVGYWNTHNQYGKDSAT